MIETENPIPDGLELTPFDDGFHADPYAVYRRLRDLDPVHQDQVSMYPNSWTITDHAVVQDLLHDPRLSVDSRSVGVVRDPRADNPVTRRAPDMMGLDDPDHARLRSLVQQAFTPRHVALFQGRIETVARTLLDTIDPGATCDVIAAYAKPLPTIVIADFLGIDSSRHADFKKWTDALLLQGYPQPTDAQWAHIVAADAALRQYVESLIETRRGTVTKDPQAAANADLISRLIAAEVRDDRLTAREVVDMCALLIGAGNFTTTDLIGNAILAVLEHPGALSMALDPARVGAVIQEVLRFDPPSHVARRFALEDIEVGDQTIAAGAVVNLVLAAANHDPKVFHDPDRFAPERERRANLAFGQGVHHCLGARLARLEGEVALHAFFERYPGTNLIEARRNRTLGFRGCKRLLVQPDGPVTP